jgi:hypothetical protein
MPDKAIINPGGAFGYTPFEDARGEQQIGVFRNMSSANPIRVGNAVAYSSASTDGTGVVVTTVLGSARFCGVAVTSASTGQTTQLSSLAPAEVWCQVVTKGKVWAHLDTAVVNGDIIGVSNTTAAAGTSNGGQLGVSQTTVGTAGFFRIAGYAHTSGSTLAPDGVTTQNPRGLVTLEPSIVFLSSV